jgi:hypothetical protein
MPRRCSNCYFNQTGNVCQLNPMAVVEARVEKIVPSALVGQPSRKETETEHRALPAFTSPDYGCSHHEYAAEVSARGWSFDDEDPAAGA